MKFCLIYDLDGTLIDSRDDLATAVNMMLATYQLPPYSTAEITTFIGNGAVKLVERALAGRQRTDIAVSDALAQMKSFYQQHKTVKTYLYPGVADGVRRLHEAGIPQAVVTNKHQEAVAEILEHFAVKPYFDVIIGAGSDFPLKPAPDALLHILEYTGSQAAASWILGDNYTDMEAGKAAGIQCCYAGYGFGKLHNSSFNTRVNSFADFTTMILQNQPSGTTV